MKTLTRCLVLLGLLLSASVAQAELKPVPVKNWQPIMQQAIYSRGLSKAGNASGTVSKKALVAAMAPSRVKVAIDSKTPDASGYDVIRFDFTGKGKFDDQLVVPFKVQGRGNSDFFQFGPETLQVTTGKKTVPVTVWGDSYITDKYKYIRLYIGTALEGSCKFGDKTYAVRVVDGNNNLKCGDKSIRQGLNVKVGDTLLIDVGDGEFNNHKNIKSSLYGSPVLIDDVWYDVKLSPDKSEITATPSAVETANLKIDHDYWTMFIIGKDGILNLSGSKEPVKIPAGRYVVMTYSQTEKGEKGHMAHLSCGSQYTRAGEKKKSFTAKAGETYDLAIGSPLTASIKSTRRGRNVSMDFSLTDAAGMNAQANIGKRTNPEVEVLDADGKSVHTGKFEYG